MSWNITVKRYIVKSVWSASLWGCELKYCYAETKQKAINVSLLVRLWVEISWTLISDYQVFVSLLVRLWVEIRLLTDQTFLALRQPPCEAVSWNTYEILYGGSPVCQPPCEAVSWNTRQLWNYCNRCIVSLLVRLWVEIIRVDAMKTETKPSASLWGCELKYSGIYQTAIHECQPPCEAVSWNSWIKS